MQHSTMVARELRSAAPDVRSGQHSSSSEASRLIAAVVSGNLTDLRVLIDEGVSPDTAWYGRTAVVWAVLHGRSDSLELLLDAGASPETLTASGKSPLEIARSLNCGHSIALLAGASVPNARLCARADPDEAERERFRGKSEALTPSAPSASCEYFILRV